MLAALPYIVAVLLIAVVFIWPAWRSFRKEEEAARAMLEEARKSGSHEPVSIRPWVDPESCMCSGSCVAACPEKNVLQIIDGRAQLVHGSNCVGHGACVASCPVNAIELRFGSERRGVDIPSVKPDFECNVPGMYVAGELGGMGLIANAAKQGVQAVENLARELPSKKPGDLDLVIVGAGPAGVSASTRAKELGLQHVMLEQGDFGGAIRHYPRKKIVFRHDLSFPGQPPIKASTLSKEELVEILGRMVQEGALPLREHERVEAVEPTEDGLFEVRSAKQTYRCARVIIAVGRRGTPRRLEVPGEELEKVAYRLLDPELVHHAHVLVVGGGDSALEAACMLAESGDNQVTLSYRKGTLTRPKEGNLARLNQLVQTERVTLMLSSTVREIAPDRVVLDDEAGEQVLPNDRVYVFAGGVLPTKFLNAAGIRMERHFGDRVEVLDGA